MFSHTTLYGKQIGRQTNESTHNKLFTVRIFLLVSEGMEPTRLQDLILELCLWTFKMQQSTKNRRLGRYAGDKAK
ncbi:hypothetical protein [Labilibaculum sp.]|uniref:hypothetical protein n=1 Tax=Labilibaculum sp. TaxID=2060723 RepID=UPI0035698292